VVLDIDSNLELLVHVRLVVPDVSCWQECDYWTEQASIGWF